jgi:hypothetical protein
VHLDIATISEYVDAWLASLDEESRRQLADLAEESRSDETAPS